MSEETRLIPPHGNYRELLSYRKAEIVYDVTFEFCQRFLSKGDRTIDQMIQAARSGKQNILEGSKASKTSTEMEIKLTNTARASLEELLDDYHDFLRARKLPLWQKDSREAQFVRRLGARPDATYARLPGILRNPRGCSRRKYRDLPYPPDELFAGSTDPAPGARFY